MNNAFMERRQRLLMLKKMREERSNSGEIEIKKYVTCRGCKNEYAKEMLKSRLYVCPNCGYHMTISARRRISQLVDKGTFKEQNAMMATKNPLEFPEYLEKIDQMQRKTGNIDAIVTGVGMIDGHKAEIVVLDPTFMMGSMGTVVGEKTVQAIEYATKNKLPLIIISASGGARMQEGMFSLMQMAKTSAALENFSKKKGLYISVLTNPTMGGVSASFAMLGDIIIAEPEALIGFAGPRVIEQTIREKLPDGFQRSEFQLEHGFVDMIVERDGLKETIATILRLHEK